MSEAKILIVEDEGVVAKDIESSLKNLDYNDPAIVSSGEEALKEVEKIKPNLVLMDIRLDGGMDGIQTAEIIRDRFHIPVVYLTAYADEATLERAKLSEPFGYIIKPFEEKELQVAVEMALYKHRMERKLQESEERLRGIFENAVIGMYRTTPDGRILMANPALVRMLGYSSFEELAKRNLEEDGYEPQYRRSEFKERIEKKGKIVGHEAAWVRKGGTTLYVRESARAVRDEAGNILYYEGTVEDITERKQAEEALRESEERHRTMFEASPEAIVFVDARGKLLAANRKIYNWLGYEPEEVLGMNIAELPFLTHESKEKVRVNFVRRMKDDEVPPYEISCIAKSGKEQVGLVHANPVRDEKGNIIADLVMISNITARKRAEEWLNKRLLYEQVLSYCSQALLEIENLNHALISVGEEILPVMEVSCVRILQIFEDPVDGRCMRLLHEAVAKGIESRLNDPLLKHIPYSEFSEHLLDNSIVDDAKGGVVRELPKEEQKTFESEGVRSLLNVPIRVGKQLWGLISLRDYVREHVWEGEDIKFLNTAASIIRAAIERRRAQKALRESEERLRATLDALPDLLFEVDREGLIYNFRAPRPDLLYVPSQEFLGRKVNEVIPEDAARVIMDAIAQAVETGTHTGAVYSLEMPTGIRWFELSIAAKGNPKTSKGRLIVTARDITERKRAEEALRESEERYRSVFELSPEAIVILDEKGKLLAANERLQNWLGYQTEGIVGKSFLELPFLTNDARTKAKDRFIQRIKGKELEPYELDFLTKSGDKVIGLVRGTPMRDENGKIVGDLVLISNITESKLAEEKIRYHAKLVTNVSDAIASTDLDFTIRSWNKAAERIFGWKEEEVIGKKVAEITFTEYPSKSREEVKEELFKKGHWEGEIIQTRKDGTPLNIYTSISLIRGNEGEPIGIVSIDRDITERKQTEDELIRLSNAMRMTTDSVVISDLEGKIIYVNEAALEMYGTEDREDLIGKNSFDLIVPGERERALLYAQETLEKGYSKNLEYHVITKEGSRIPVEMSTSLMRDAEGKPIGFVGVIRDITERKKAEDALREAYKAREELEQILNQSEAIIFLWRNAEGWPVEFVSDNVSLYGYSPEECYSGDVKFADIVHSDDLARVADEIKRYSEEGRTEFTQLYRIVTKMGDVRWVDDRTLIRRDHEGKITHYQGIVLDITERKQAEEQLNWELTVNRALSELYEPLVVTSSSREEIARAVLRQAQALTKSQYGYVSEIDPQTGNNICHTLVDMIGVECKVAGEYRRIVFTPDSSGHYPSLWGHSLNTHKRFYTNSPKTHPASQGIPDGHISLQRFLSVPVMLGEELVGQISLANSQRDYTERDVEAISRLGEFYALAIQDRRAKEALRESEERYRAFTDEALVGVYIYQDGKYLFVNQAMEEITGYSKDELLSMTPHAFFLPGDRNSLDKRVEVAEQRLKASSEYTIDIHRKDGEAAVIEVRVRSIPYGEGVAYLGNCIDITERVRQREQIELARKEWERTFDSISDLVMILGPDRRILKANQAVVKYIGVKFNELLGKSYLEVFHQNNKKNTHGKDIPDVDSRLAEFFEITDPETSRIFSISVSPLFDSQGEIMATVNVARDVTQMHEFEQALMESELQFRGLAESTQDIIFSVDADGSVLYLNPAFEKILGYNPAEYIGVNIRDLLISPVLNSNTRYILKKYLDQPDLDRAIPLFEVNVKDVKRRKHILEISTGFLTGQFIGVARDVTERKRMEQQLLRASKFASIGMLAAGIGHQVNNPLASILATSTALKEICTSTQGLPEEFRKKASGYLSAMEQQLDRTHQVVSSLLEFAKEKRMNVMPYNVNHIVREALQFLSQHLSFRNISLELSLDNALPLASVDRDALQQVIVNVVQNAFEAMEGSGNLVIRTAKERKDMVSLSISNNGPPIPANIREEMFELLFTTKTTQKGTGLGLPISTMLLEHFGGRLYLEESRDEETKFVIEVPIHARREK